MIYFMDEGKKRKKYEIVVDKNGLEKLKVEIINNCSMIIHHDCNTTETPNYYDILRIRNYSDEKIGIYESNDFYASRETLYHVIYDEYKYPYLIELIDRLLNNDEEALDEILNPNFEKEQISIDKMINILEEKYNSISLSEIVVKREILEKLSQLYKLKELNKNQISVIGYYSKVKNFIKLKLIDDIDIELINRVNKFNTKPKTYVKNK